MMGIRYSGDQEFRPSGSQEVRKSGSHKIVIAEFHIFLYGFLEK